MQLALQPSLMKKVIFQTHIDSFFFIIKFHLLAHLKYTCTFFFFFVVVVVSEDTIDACRTIFTNVYSSLSSPVCMDLVTKLNNPKSFAYVCSSSCFDEYMHAYKIMYSQGCLVDNTSYPPHLLRDMMCKLDVMSTKTALNGKLFFLCVCVF